MSASCFPNPGIYRELPEAEYHADTKAHSSSAVRLCYANPAAYHWEYILGNRRTETPLMALGKAAHAYILEGADLAVAPPEVLDKAGRRTTRAYKDWAKAAKADGKIEVSATAAGHIRGMEESLLSDPNIGWLLRQEDREVETTYVVDDPSTGIRLKARADLILKVNDLHWMVDLKTTSDPTPRAFSYKASDARYDMQMAFYEHVIESLRPEIYFVAFFLIAIQTDPPYDAWIYRISETDMDVGITDIVKAIARLDICMRTGNYPNPGRGDYRYLNFYRRSYDE